MKFKTLKMKNFMRYKGENTIEFSCDDEKKELKSSEMQAIKCMSQPPRRREIRIISVISCFLLNWIINPKQGTQ